MAEYSGSALYLEWITSGGTTVLSGDFRSLTYTPSIDLIEATAGADAQKSYLNAPKDGQASAEIVSQADGTALWTALAEGTSGTVRVSPEGTATGKPRFYFAAISLGAGWSQPYADIVSVSPSWQQNGARTDDNW